MARKKFISEQYKAAIFITLGIALVVYLIVPPSGKKEAEKYVKRFERESGDYGFWDRVGGIDFEFSPLGTRVEGVCLIEKYRSGKVVLKITINSDAWNSFSELGREQLLFHELGHCVLFREHSNEIYSDGTRFRSIMAKYGVPEKIYKMHREEYIEELFKNAPRR